MRIIDVTISNLRSIASTPTLPLSAVTVLVGPNNSGKSTILAALHAIQQTGALDLSHVRFGAPQPNVKMTLAGSLPPLWARPGQSADGWHLEITSTAPHDLTLRRSDGGFTSAGHLPAREPEHVIYPYLSKRKVGGYDQSISSSVSRDVRSDLSNLAAKVDRLNDPRHPAHDQFTELVDTVIGLPLTAVQSVGGKQVGIWLDNVEYLPLEQMGDGVAQLLGLIVSLCIADEKIFLIEELENDVHPQALKLLLSAIADSSTRNQFVVSTHSNIVMRHLGALEGTVIYDVSRPAAPDHPAALAPTVVRRVGTSVAERTELLSRLGYELSDMDLYDGWLLFEESSAERIVREHLIPWFTPALTRVRTVAAQGASDLDATFSALEKLVLFTHLQERYRGRVRVLADGDDAGEEAVEKLRSKHPDWGPDSFRTLSAHAFEEYYPPAFQDAARIALGLRDKKARRDAKRLLLGEVLVWVREDPQRAKAEFQVSATEVIDQLREFENLFSSST